MNYDLENATLGAVLAEGRVVADETRRTFSGLSTRQINWQPDAGEWSIAQCFDHLVISNRPYIPLIEQIREGRKRPRLQERLPLFRTLFARLILRTLRPDSGRKARARQALLPSSSQIEPDVIPSFLEQQDRLLALMAATRGLDLDRITVTSPVFGLVTYSLMDAYRIVVAHEQNHFVQARRVMESKGFPA